MAEPGALRSVFASFGFEIDDKALDALLDKTEKTIAAEEGLSKVQKKALADLKKRKAEEEKDAKKAEGDRAKKAKAEEAEAKANGTLAGQLSKVHPALGKVADMAGVGGAHLTNFMVRAAGLGAVVVGVAQSLHAFAVAFAADVEQLRESADAARVTTHEFQALGHAGAAAGVSASTTAAALNTLGQGLRAIETRTGGPTGALHRLGVMARNANGTMRETNDVLYDVADRFERVRNPVQRARLAQELFGANGRRMLQVLAGGSAALRRQHADFEALGGGVLPEAVEAARGFTAAQQRMKVATDSIRSVIATALLPVITAVTNKIADFTGWLSRMARGSNIVQVVLGMLGVAAAAVAAAIIVSWLPVIAPFLAVGVAIAALALIVDDLISLFNGGNSAVGEFLDSMVGVGTSAELVEMLTEDWEDLKVVFQEVKEILEFIVGLHRRILGGAVRHVGGTLRGVVDAARHFLPGGGRSAPGTPPLGLPPPPEAGGLIDGPMDRRRVDRRTRRAIERANGPQLVDGSRLAGPAPAWMQGGMVDGSGFSGPTTAPLASGGARTVNNTTHRVSNPQFHITGVTDPAEVARRVRQIMTEQERQERDGRHPTNGED